MNRDLNDVGGDSHGKDRGRGRQSGQKSLQVVESLGPSVDKHPTARRAMKDNLSKEGGAPSSRAWRLRQFKIRILDSDPHDDHRKKTYFDQAYIHSSHGTHGRSPTQ